MDRRILLEYYLNKYVTSQYNLIERIDVLSIDDMAERIDVDVLIIIDSERFKLNFNLFFQNIKFFFNRIFFCISILFMLITFFSGKKATSKLA